MKKHYTKKEYDELLKHFRIVCQTNEQSNAHILKGFEEKGIGYVNRSIPEGDYSLMIKSCPELGFPIDTYFFDEVFIERKNSLQELAGSLYGNKDSQLIVKRFEEAIKECNDITSKKASAIIRDVKSEYSFYDDPFHRELKRAINKPFKFLLVEQPSGWDGILKHDYPNQYNPLAFWAMLHSIEIKYGLSVKFISKQNMAMEIYTICKCVLDSKIDR